MRTAFRPMYPESAHVQVPAESMRGIRKLLAVTHRKKHMPQEFWLLLIGGFIGLSSSLITLLLSNYFQRRNDERKRSWELEDRKNNIKLEVRRILIKEGKANLKTFSEANKILIDIQYTIKGADFQQIDSEIERAAEIIKSSSNQLVSLKALDDKELSELVDYLITLYRQDEWIDHDLSGDFYVAGPATFNYNYNKLLRSCVTAELIIRKIQDKLLVLYDR